jgi:hypothetical protein
MTHLNSMSGIVAANAVNPSDRKGSPTFDWDGCSFGYGNNEIRHGEIQISNGRLSAHMGIWGENQFQPILYFLAIWSTNMYENDKLVEKIQHWTTNLET